MCCHAFCESVHESLCLDVEVTKHGIRSPAAKQLDFVFVNIGAQKSHGPTSAEAAGFDVFCGKTEGGFAKDEDCSTQGLCNMCWSDAEPLSGVV